ncbi:hypothetical protein BB559_003775 [Furculomyces boomerangus]|uniref:Uncharacterized protein n=1 Tax=Furculomyces boomerangus TaxID=61424 RepID=A0A2T9YIT1_9FUNG|nr:hypothetical protein BB559_003775 [Furculomyces boomerangus]
MAKPVSYDSKEYWQTRFEKENTFEWLLDYSSMKDVFEKYLSKASKIINLGCGNSNIPFGWYENGYGPSLNVDYCENVIEKMKSKTREKYPNPTNPELIPSWDTIDVLNMDNIESSTFDFIFEKSTSDAIACSDENGEQLSKLEREVYRICKNGGTWVSVSYSSSRWNDVPNISTRWIMETIPIACKQNETEVHNPNGFVISRPVQYQYYDKAVPSKKMVPSNDQINYFNNFGFLIVENFLERKEIDMLYEEGNNITNFCLEQGDLVTEWGCVIEPFGSGYLSGLGDIPKDIKTNREKYFNTRKLAGNEKIEAILDKYYTFSKALVPNPSSPVLFNEQYIVKPPNSKAEFSWHQDRLYLKNYDGYNIPIISCWTPLQDMNTKNGSLIIKPYKSIDRNDDYSSIGIMESIPSYVSHHGNASNDQEQNIFDSKEIKKLDLYSKRKNDSRSDFLLDICSGSVAFMSGWVLHSSSFNNSGKYRFCYMPQFSCSPVYKKKKENEIENNLVAYAIGV